ncbi:MAG TPA: hypothetical protein VMP03_06120, partial [Methylomirabilota bacterium]|nr:hypothetical protein [Methylomirabilota bacterium]
MHFPDRSGRGRDPVLSLLLTNAFAGSVVALIVVFAILVLDIGQLQTLISGSEQPLVPAILLSAGFIVTFASVAMGTAIMRIGRPDGGSPGGLPQGMVPVPIRARRIRRGRLVQRAV